MHRNNSMRQSGAAIYRAGVIERLKARRQANNLSQSQAVKLLNAAGLPAKLKTLQGWEIAWHSPQAITAAALERFLDQHATHPSPPRVTLLLDPQDIPQPTTNNASI